MSEIQKWFDRKFDLSFPVALYPNILVRLRGTPARLEELVGPIPARRSLASKMGRGQFRETWAPVGLEPLWLSRLDDFASGIETLRAADLSNRKTHQANHNSHNVQEILSEFRNARGNWSNVQRTRPKMYSRSALHPV